MSMIVPSELRYSQSVDTVTLGVGAYEFHEGDLPAKIKSGHQTVISSCDFEPDALAIEHFGFRSRFLDVVCRSPMCGGYELVPAFERDSCFRMIAPKTGKRVSSNDPAFIT